MDPNIAALLGAGAGNGDFMQMLMKAINPNAASDLRGEVGAPNVDPLANLVANAPSIATASPQPALAGPQMLQTLGFGMAGASGQPGATGLSSMGVGGTNVIKEGGNASDRAIREAAQENNAAIAEWNGKSKIADDILQTQMKSPELDMKLMDLTGATAAREDARRDNSLYRAGLLENAGAKTGVAQDNAKTAKGRLGVSQQRADTYDGKVTGDQDLKAQALMVQAAKIDQQATEFENALLERSKAQGQRLGLETAQAAAREFRNEMLLRSPVDPMTGQRNLPDAATQQALQESLAAKYTKAAQGPAPAAAAVQKQDPATALAQAKAAIAAGADAAKVHARLVELGIDPRGLTQ